MSVYTNITISNAQILDPTRTPSIKYLMIYSLILQTKENLQIRKMCSYWRFEYVQCHVHQVRSWIYLQILNVKYTLSIWSNKCAIAQSASSYSNTLFTDQKFNLITLKVKAISISTDFFLFLFFLILFFRYIIFCPLLTTTIVVIPIVNKLLMIAKFRSKPDNKPPFWLIHDIWRVFFS